MNAFIWVIDNAALIVAVCSFIMVCKIELATSKLIAKQAKNAVEYPLVLAIKLTELGMIVEHKVHTQEEAQEALNAYMFHRIAHACVRDCKTDEQVALMDNHGRLIGV